MNLSKLIQMAVDDDFDIIHIYAMAKGVGIRVSFESRNPEAAAVSLFELPTVKFDRSFIRQAMEERKTLVSAGWDFHFDQKALHLKRLTMTEIMSVFAPRTETARVA